MKARLQEPASNRVMSVTSAAAATCNPFEVFKDGGARALKKHVLIRLRAFLIVQHVSKKRKAHVVEESTRTDVGSNRWSYQHVRPCHGPNQLPARLTVLLTYIPLHWYDTAAHTGVGTFGVGADLDLSNPTTHGTYVTVDEDGEYPPPPSRQPKHPNPNPNPDPLIPSARYRYTTGKACILTMSSVATLMTPHNTTGKAMSYVPLAGGGDGGYITASAVLCSFLDRILHSLFYLIVGSIHTTGC